MNNSEIVDYRFGEQLYINEFLTPDSFMIKSAVDSLPLSGDVIKNIADFIRDGFKYPFTSSGIPSTDGQLLRYKKGLLGYHFKECRNYVVAYPIETLVSKYGFCIETANLCTSLLLKTNEDAWVDVGEVRRINPDQLLGYHAWSVVRGGLNIAIETTIHDAGQNTIIPIFDLYDKNSDWAKEANLYYIVHGRYNKDTYIEETPFARFCLRFLFLPKAFCEPMMGINIFNPKKLYKMWRKDHAELIEAINLGWKNGEKK